MKSTHRGRHSTKKDIFKTVKQYCVDLSKKDPELRETVFLGYPEDAVAFVMLMYPDANAESIPETPQGVVLFDNRGLGVLQ